MEWVRIRGKLRVAEGHLYRAVSTSESPQQLLDEDETRLVERQALDRRPPACTGKVLLFVAKRHTRGYSRRRSAL